MQDRYLYTIQLFASELIAEEDYMYQTTEEECVISFLALARFAKLDMMEMREAVEDIKIQCAQWESYEEAAVTTRTMRKEMTPTLKKRT